VARRGGPIAFVEAGMSRRRRAGVLLSVWLALVGGPGSARPAAPDEDDDGSFGLTAPVACKEIKGYEDYVPLPRAALTSDEKLLVYFRPRHFKTAQNGDSYEAHFTQDGRIRRRGEKAVLWSKKNLLDYRPTTENSPPRLVYLKNTVALKGLKPGEYEYEIVLRDEIGRSAPAVRALPFTVLPPPAAGEASKKDGPGNTDTPLLCRNPMRRPGA
jgi:hypothetical protein